MAQAGEILKALREANPDIIGAALVTRDGFAVASDLGPNIDAESLAALSADLLVRASRSAGEFGQGKIEELYARTSQGYFIVARVGDDQVLACLASTNATLGLLLMDVRKTAAVLV
jgi:predicted regulator of Ras-like GTPase activity (Roadblock/LC7/MglB family)